MYFVVNSGSHEYNETSLKEATDLQSQMSSDMGGTEILQPLKHMYENMKIKDGYPRQVLQSIHINGICCCQEAKHGRIRYEPLTL